MKIKIIACTLLLPMVALSTHADKTPSVDKQVALNEPVIQVATPKAFKGVLTDRTNMKTLSATEFDAIDHQTLTIHKKNASFIKVHFSRFTVPDGVVVEVRNKSGSQVHRYGGTESSLSTRQPGDDGIHSFSALSIIGETAIIEIIMPTIMPQSFYVEIDSYMEGIPQQELDEIMFNQQSDSPQSLSTCGVNERRDVQCWSASHPTEFERTRPVARLLMNGSGLCTGWRVGGDNHMFTNNHCVASASGIANTEVWFNYQHTACGGSTLAGTKIVTGASLLATDYELDYTLFTVNNFEQISSYGHFGLDVRNALSQERIYIAQHGAGNPKELAIESDQNSGGLCRVDQTEVNGRGTDTDMGYYCDTTGGSSGSPVLAASSNNVIALHHFGGCPNQGVLINRIWPQVASHFNNQIPTGDNQQPSGDPVASFNYARNGLEVTFTDTSDDSDGTIVSRQWSFGDGTQSSETNPVHSYAVAGDYPVTLTVTDNDGNTDNNTQQVSVSNAGDGRLTKGVPVSNLSSPIDGELDFYFDVPAEARSVSFNISKGSGDADLYVKFGEPPTISDYDCRPYRSGNSETCNFSAAQTGRYYVMLKAYNAFSGVELVADYTEAVDGVSFEEVNLSDSRGSWRHFTLDVPVGMQELIGRISGGSGDADLYVRFGAQPTTSSYDCRPYYNGNNETCNFSNPQAGTWYFSIRAYRSYSGVALRGEAQ